MNNNLMTLDEMREHEWVVSWSGGKDSTATIILMHENEVPVKKIIYVRMMYDDQIPATLPKMINFIDHGKSVFESWGYNVEVVPSNKTALQIASTIYHKSKYAYNNGHPYGITAFVKLVQCENASLPIDVTLLGMMTLVKLVQCSKL